MSDAQKLFVGLIPDGNRRWAMRKYGKATKETLSRDELYDAHWTGAEAIKRVAERAREESVDIFAAWGGSVANLTKRESREVAVLHSVFERLLTELRDDWMDRGENQTARFVAMGRREHLQDRVPTVIQLIDEITEHTRERTGMVLVLCLDYDGLDEGRRAHRLWKERGYPGDEEGWKQFLDLPLQGIPCRDLNLILRTGVRAHSSKYDNEFLHCYQNETRLRHREIFWPDYTPDMFNEDLHAFLQEEQRRGG